MFDFLKNNDFEEYDAFMDDDSYDDDLFDEEAEKEYEAEIKKNTPVVLKRTLVVLLPFIIFTISFTTYGIRSLLYLGYMATHMSDRLWGRYLSGCRFGLISCACFFVCLGMLSKKVSFKNVLAAFFCFLAGLFTVVTPAFYLVDFSGYLTKRTGMYIPALLAVIWFLAITLYKYINENEKIALWKRLAPGVLLAISFIWWSAAVSGLQGYPEFWSEHLFAGIIVSLSAIIYGIWIEMPVPEIDFLDLLIYWILCLLTKKKQGKDE